MGCSQDAIKDSYDALKEALKKKFGAESDLVDAVNKLERDPKREDRQATVKTEVEIAKDTDDNELKKLAQNLLDKISKKPGGEKMINNITQNTKAKYGAISGTGHATLEIGSLSESSSDPNHDKTNEE